ncbi:hypothetical protein BD413DRAFT_583032 [Trametes elegans]|nr:hypothetical protein BD413DRAFT_583032 [Trametes elegans]
MNKKIGMQSSGPANHLDRFPATSSSFLGLREDGVWRVGCCTGSSTTDFFHFSVCSSINITPAISRIEEQRLDVFLFWCIFLKIHAGPWLSILQCWRTRTRSRRELSVRCCRQCHSPRLRVALVLYSSLHPRGRPESKGRVNPMRTGSLASS